MTRQIHLGVFVLGTGNQMAAWRHPDATTSFQDLRVTQGFAQTAEHGKCDLLFLGDSPLMTPNTHSSYMVRPDPLLLLSAIAHGPFDKFVDQVVPELQSRGMYRKDCTGVTLRDHLGLKRPAARQTGALLL